MLHKMKPNEDPEAFLLTFERVATAHGWTVDRWVTTLAPLLIGEAQAAYQALPADKAMDYQQLKAAILDRLGLTPETYRRRFRTVKYTNRDRPRVVAHRLVDLCTMWIQPEKHDKAEILEQFVLEQFIQILPPSSRSWVKRHAAFSLNSAVRLVENFLGDDTQQDSWERPVQTPVASGDA
ncbi:hypothetical protein FKM82_027422 [Ascaphus truei]